MSKIYFHVGEKDRLKAFVKNTKSSTFDIDFVKKTNIYNESLIQYTTIAESLVNIIVEYTHELITMHCTKKAQLFTITLKDQFTVCIKHYLLTNLYSVCIKHINSLFNSKEVRIIQGNNELTPTDIINGELYRLFCAYSCEYFMNYYMDTYYNKHEYIKNLRYQDDNYYGIYQNTYYQRYWSCNNFHYYQIMRILDHRKIKQMIIIVKLFVDLLSKV